MIDKEQAKNRTGQVVKNYIKMSMKPLLIGIGIFLAAVIIFSAVTWFLKKLDTKENSNDPKNAPAAVRNFMNDTTIDENGNITSGKSIQELWNELKQNGNRATAYLNSAEELGKLIYAARALDYPDTRRENIDDPIKWNELDINSKEIQGIVKFKRALADGENITMTYVSPSELKELINKYKSTGNESDREEALKHFTIEKSYSDSSNTGNNNDIAKVDSLQGMVFMGDSILSTFNEFKGDELKNQEGAILMYKSGSNAKYFTGRGTVDNSDYNTIETANGHFDWNANFQRVTNPTGFYLMLGQNALFHDDRIEEIDELVKIIKSKYPAKPIYISSVLHYIDSDGSAEEKATSMNEELKVYCEGNNGVYYSDILRGYNDNLEAMTKDDNDHPNSQGVQVLLNNIKQNIIQTSSTSSISTTSSTSSTKTGSSTSQVVAPIDDFSEETRQIIMSHINDFNENNFESFINSFPGGYDGYMQSLGGVFAKYGGKGKKIEINNAGDLQEAAEFVWGLMSIWGFDYWNDSTYWSWGEDEEFEGLHNGAYYPSHSYTGGGWQSGQGNMNDVCADANKVKRTNCNAGIDSFLWTTTLENNSYGSNFKIGERIDKKEDLQVGDFVHFFHEQAETQDSWGHVAIVGEKDPNTGDVILYDSGNRFIRTGRYKFPLSLESGGAYDNYEKWVGRRHYDLDQSTNRTASNSTKRNTVYKVKVATWSEHLDKVESNDSEVNTYDTGIDHNMTTTTIPYQEIVSKYKMPFNYLWTMLVYSNDKNYTFDLADLVKNSKIEITVHDNLNETTNVVTDTYTDYTKIHAEADVDIAFDQVNYEVYKNIGTDGKLIGTTRKEVITDGKTTEHGVADGEKWDPYYVIHTTVTKTNTLDIALTLADAWCAKYEKKYTYNEPQETENNSSSTLDDIPKESYTRNGELGGLEENVVQDALNKASASDRRSLEPTGHRENEIANYQTTRITRVKSTYTKIRTSSYSSAGGTNIDRSTVSIASTPKTGSLNPSNYVPLNEPSTHRDGDNPLQGFCLVGDDMVAYVIHHYSSNTCTLCLADINTMQIYDQIDGFENHGNTIAYDSVTGDIIFPESRTKMGLVTVNKTTRKFENKRAISPPLQSGFPSQIAYNATHDLIIAGSHVYTRQAFYSGGSPIKDLEFKKLGNHLDAGSTSYGNHVYYYFAEGYSNSKGYFIVCDLNTGKQVEIIQDNMPREAEEASFSSDGTLYTAYAGGDAPFHKTDYNYFMDNNIDKSNVSANGSGTANEFAKYNTGGKHTENLYFEKVFNSHYNARSNILSAIGWLYDALEQNEDTANMVDITKYLIGRAKGNPENEEEFLAAIEKLQEGFTNMADAGGKSGIDGIQGQIYDYLLAKGVPPVGAAAIMGNIQGESSFKPDVVNSIGCSGLCQWYKGRLDNLKKLAESKGKNWTDVECQLDYLWEELNNKYTKVRDVIMAADQESELEYATWYWGRYFEVFFLGDSFEATKGNTATRYKYAQHWYQEWQQHHTSGTTSSVAYAHASAEEKVKGLFPNGVPQTREQAESYLTTINVPITSKDGTKGTRGVKVHRAIAQDVYNACVAAQNSGFKIYDIGGYRTFGTDTAGKSGGLSYSQHCYGLAVDINPTENGQFKNGRATGNWFYDPGGNEYSIQANSILVTTFKSMGWGWGGEWNSSKDYMHFSFMGT